MILKTECDIAFLHCKKNNLIVTFPGPNFGIRINFYLQNKMLHQVLETEIKNQHRKKKSLICLLNEKTETLATRIDFICRIAFCSKTKRIAPDKMP